MSKSDFQNKDVGLNKGAKIAPSSGAVALLKPHGKYFGMDTFSCLNPDLDVLEKTIMNFPFDLLWIGNQNEIKVDKFQRDGGPWPPYTEDAAAFGRLPSVCSL